MPPRTTKRKRTKSPSDYPHLTIRPTRSSLARLEALSKANGQPIRSLVNDCIAGYLCRLEEAAR